MGDQHAPAATRFSRAFGYCASVAEPGLLGPPPQPTGPRGCSWASGYDPQSPILFVVLFPLLPALDNKPRLAQKPDRCVGILVAEKISR